MTIQIVLTVIASVLVLIFTFAVGVVIGVLLKPGTPHREDSRPTSETAADRLPNDKADRLRREAEEDAEAFSLLMGYSRDLAYGQTTAFDLKRERGDR